MASGSFVFEDELLHSLDSSSVLLIVGHPEHSASSTEVAVLLNFENHPKCACFPFYAHQKLLPTFRIIFFTIFSQFKIIFVPDTLFFQVFNFLGMAESQVKQCALALNKTLLNNHMLHPYSNQQMT
jgi:hypothetical protein